MSGVLSSWLMLARKSDLCRLADSSCRPFSAISRNSRAFWIASADCVANVFSSSTISGANGPGVLAVDQQSAEQAVLAQQRDGEEGTISGAEEQLLAHALVAVIERIGDLGRLERDGGASERAIPFAGGSVADAFGDVLWHVLRRLQPELLGTLVVFVDRPAVEPRDLHRPGDDRLEHDLEVQRRTDRLPDLAERRELSDGASERLGTRIQHLEQTYVLDRDHRLTGEGLQQLHLLVGEASNVGARDRDRTDDLTLAQHGYAQAAAKSGQLGGFPQHVFRVGKHVGNVHHDTSADDPPDNCVTRGVQRALPSQGIDAFLIHPEGAPQVNPLAIEREYQAVSGVTKARRSLGDGVEHRLHVRRRAADHLQDLAGRRLPLERLLGLVEQAHVLDRDHRLVGEGLEQRDLRVRKRPGFGPGDRDCADGVLVAHQRNGQEAAKSSA